MIHVIEDFVNNKMRECWYYLYTQVPSQIWLGKQGSQYKHALPLCLLMYNRLSVGHVCLTVPISQHRACIIPTITLHGQLSWGNFYIIMGWSCCVVLFKSTSSHCPFPFPSPTMPSIPILIEIPSTHVLGLQQEWEYWAWLGWGKGKDSEKTVT